MRSFSVVLIFLLFGFSSEIQQQKLVDISSLSSGFEYDIRYATPNNFIKETLYNCEVCLLQKEVAEALVKANDYLCELGFKIKLYDCYRPLSVQKKMWKKVPRPTYVANPFGKGSIHNRGAAVDITIVTLEGCYVEMGSDYDFFGRASHIDNTTLPKEVLNNRKVLQTAMKKLGFQTVRTEWWPVSYTHLTLPTTPYV